MARTNLPVLVPASRSGLSIADSALTAADSVNGHKFFNDGRTVFIAQNTNAATRTITFLTPGSIDGNAIADLAVVIAATTGRLITPSFPATVYSQSDGYVYVDYSAATGLLVAAVKIPWEVML